MSAPTDRQSFIDYCLRKLGAPVIKINVDDDQVSDRVDDAIQKYQEYHFDGVERYYLKHQIQQTDIDNEFIPITDPLIIGIIRVFPVSQSTINMFDVRYQVRLNDFYNFNNVSVTHYYMTMNHLALLDFLFNVIPTCRFNRKDRKIFLNADWAGGDFTVGQYIVFEAYRAVDPTTLSDVWNDMFLKELATNLIQKQWGENLRKFGNIQLPGGVVLNGDKLYDDAVTNILRLEKDLNTTYQLPCDFFMGAIVPIGLFLLPLINYLRHII